MIIVCHMKMKSKTQSSSLLVDRGAFHHEIMQILESQIFRNYKRADIEKNRKDQIQLAKILAIIMLDL